MYDIAIIGAGPSGATLARLLNKTLKVLLIDKRDFYSNTNNGINLNANEQMICENNPRVKCCGGLLAPDAQKMLATLGLGIPKEVLVGPQLFTVRTIDFDNNIEKFYQRSYVNINREKFDSYLLSLVGDNVDIHLGAVFKAVKEISDGYEIEYFQNGNTNKVLARLLIGADGAMSKIRNLILDKKVTKGSANKTNLKYVAVQETFFVSQSLPYFSSIFDKEISDFYSWVIPKENHILVGAAVREDDDVLNKFEILKKKLENKGFQLDNKVNRHGSHIIRPISFNDISTGDGSIFLVGEAAGFISPSSAEGISYALRSSMDLAEAINQNYCEKPYVNIDCKSIDLVRRKYKKSSYKTLLNILIKNLKSPAMYNSNLRKIVMKSGILSMKEPLKGE